VGQPAVGSDLVVGVDLGTTGTKTGLYTVAGELLAQATSDTPLNWHGRGRVDQDPEDFYLAATSTIATVVARAGADPAAVRAIGISGQMAGVMGIDRRWRPTTPYDSWLDLRCAGEVERLEAEAGDEIAALSGCPPMVNHGAKIAWWRRHRPDEFGDTVAWIPPGSYVAGRLAGLSGDAAFVDTSYLHFTGLADIAHERWSDRLAGLVGVADDRLARIVTPATPVGELAGPAASACGLRPGTVIAAGLGDTAAATLGAGIVRPGQLLDVAGTAAILAVSSDRFRPDVADRTLITMRGAVAGQWVSLAYLSGGPLLGWLAELVLGREAAEDGAATPETLDRLCVDAERVPAGAEGLLFLPYLDGRILPSEPALRGSFIGLDRRHRAPQLTRAVLESVALEYDEYLEILRGLHPALAMDEVRVSGGGARSSTWCAIKASALDVPYRRLARAELGCWGAALVAAAGAGLIDDLADAAERATPASDRIAPVAAETDTYRRLLPIRRDLVAAAARAGRALDDLVPEPEEIPA
jgi:xylulokinase